MIEQYWGGAYAVINSDIVGAGIQCHLSTTRPMHEISLMQAALSAALDYAKARDARQIHRLQLHVGTLSGVDPEALAFAFDVVSIGTLAEKAELELTPIPVRCYCPSCQQMFQPSDWVYECPYCHNLSADIRQGKALELASLEIS